MTAVGGASVPAPLAPVVHQHGHVRRVHRLQRLDDAEVLDRLLDPRAAADAGSVDQGGQLAVAFELDADRIARGAGHVGGNNALLAEQAIDES